MHRRIALVALTLMGAAACTGGSTDGSGLPGFAGPTQPGGAPPTVLSQVDRSWVLIGAQPVEDTPVASLPAHPGHDPLEKTPPEAVAALTTVPPPSREWVVSTQGNDGNAGNAQAPFRTIGRALTAAGPGERIRVLSGTYAEKVVIGGAVRAGTADKPVVLQGDGRPKLVPTSEGTGGMVQVQRPYWVVDGFDIDVQKQAQFAVTFDGNTTGSVLANSELRNGTLGGAVTTFNNANKVTIENNHIHHFVRGSSLDSHGVVIQPTSKNITVRNNDIHDNSGDSVQCLGPEGFNTNAPAAGVLIENNHFYANRENAVDIKTCKNVVIRNNRMHSFRMSSTARGDAVVIHMSAANVLVEGNDIYDAGKGIALGGNRVGPPPSGVVIRKNRIHDTVLLNGEDGSGIRVENATKPQILGNTFTRIAGTAVMVGGGTGGATADAVVKNNVIDAARVVHVGTQAPGLVMDRNLIRTNATFSEYLSGSVTVRDLAYWRTKGLETTSVTAAAPLVSEKTLVPVQEAVDKGVDIGTDYCGAAPDIGAVETGC